MKLYPNKYYHIYNRTNNKELLFRANDNYGYFIKKYRYYMDEYLETIGYCLMPTHFHLLVKVKEIVEISSGTLSIDDYSLKLSLKIGALLNSYSQAYNKVWNRHGNLFTQKTKAKLIDDDRYLITLLAYIHQNPLRAGIVSKPEEWKYSSYLDYFDFRNGTLPHKELILSMINKEDFRVFSSQKIDNIDPKYWI